MYQVLYESIGTIRGILKFYNTRIPEIMNLCRPLPIIKINDFTGVRVGEEIHTSLLIIPCVNLYFTRTLKFCDTQLPTGACTDKGEEKNLKQVGCNSTLLVYQIMIKAKLWPLFLMMTRVPQPILWEHLNYDIVTYIRTILFSILGCTNYGQQSHYFLPFISKF